MYVCHVPHCVRLKLENLFKWNDLSNSLYFFSCSAKLRSEIVLIYWKLYLTRRTTMLSITCSIFTSDFDYEYEQTLDELFSSALIFFDNVFTKSLAWKRILPYTWMYEDTRGLLFRGHSFYYNSSFFSYKTYFT